MKFKKFVAMKVLFLCVCALYVVVGQDVSNMNRMPKYDSRYDYLDVDAILDSKRLVRNYVECLINQQRCTPEGKALKSECSYAFLFRSLALCFVRDLSIMLVLSSGDLTVGLYLAQSKV